VVEHAAKEPGPTPVDQEEAAMFGLGAQELMLILLIALVVFGGSKIPELGRSLGQAIREFKKGVESPDATTPATKPGDTKPPGP
jgi:sec-independent protein translocase protein TatA